MLFNLLFFITLFLFYFILIQRRKKIYQSTASYLGGEYFSESIFKTGKIIGRINNKEYIVEPRVVGLGSSDFRTFFSIECKNEGMLLLLKIGFLKKFPDWRKLYKLKEKREEEKNFISKLFSSNYMANSYERIEEYKFNDAQKKSIEGVFCNIGFDSKKSFFFPSLIQIERDIISLDIIGLILDKKKIKNYISMLVKLAEKLESLPVK